MVNVSTAEAIEMIKQGKRVSDIAKQCSVTRQAIYWYINKVKKQSQPKCSNQKKNYNAIIDWKVYNEGLVSRYNRLTTLKEYLEDEEGWKKKNGWGQRWKVEVRYSVFKRVFGEHIFF